MDAKTTKKGEADVDGRVVSYSYPRPDVEVTVGSGHSRDENDAGGKKVERVYPFQSNASIPQSGTPNPGM